MIRNIIILVILFCANVLRAQNFSALERIDNETKLISTETDKNKYNYNYPRWRQNAQNIFEQTPDSILKSYNFTNLKHEKIDKTDIFYFIKNINNTHIFNWIAINHENGRTVYIFDDAIPMNVSQKPIFEKRVVRDLVGFNLCDSATNTLIFNVPDIATRLNFEILVDIKYSDEEKRVAQKKVKVALEDFLYTDEAIEQKTNGFPRMSVVENAAKTVRVITYMTSYADFTSVCHGFVVHKSAKDGQIKCEYLTDRTEEIGSAEYAKLKPEKWYGAIYSSLVEIQIGKQLYYTLLGFKSNDGLVKTRVIDILSFKNDKSIFGAPYFLHDKATYLRRIFQYSSEANMLLRYDIAQQRIVFDHLSPSNSMFSGEYRFYGPDFSYDAYETTKDGWHFVEDIDYKQDTKKK